MEQEKIRENKNYEGKEIVGFSHTQIKFEDLDEEGKHDFFAQAWDKYKTTNKTNLLESFTTGLVFAQMTAKQGIKKYGKVFSCQVC